MKEQLAIRHFGESTDIANAVMYLSTAVGAYVNGTVLDVDGGFVLGDASGDFSGKGKG
jgi:3-oxoacyl-[acyl-carrier protein] reductase